MQQARNTQQQQVSRYRVVRVVLLIIGFIFVGRLFYLQVIQHDYYTAKADTSHLDKLVLEAERGEIYAKDGDDITPLAMNQTRKRVVADPRFITKNRETARLLSEVTGSDPEAYETQLEKDTAYVVLEEGLDVETGNKVAELNLKGIGLRDTTERVYPEKSLAAHVLGFVNAAGVGQYGVEQYFDDQLGGTQGLLSGTFDINGIPVATAENTEIDPVDGDDVVLTLDRRVQKQVETLLRQGIEEYEARSGSVVVMDPATGAVKAMANYPTYEPANYSKVEDQSVFINDIISSPLETGSVFKPLAMALGLHMGVITPDSTYYDESVRTIDDFQIRNAGAAVETTRTMTEVITKSVNTGMIYVLERLGGEPGSIDSEDKQLLYDFYTKKLRLDKETNIELAGENTGVMEPPTSSDARYANMTFGQGLTVTMLQNIAAEAAVINGGTYYKPYIVDSFIKPNGDTVATSPQALVKNVVSEETSQQVREMMETVVESGGGYTAYRSEYRIGGKTGSAQVANRAEGGYYNDREIGTFVGFGPVEDPRYIVMVRLEEPQNTISAYAGSGAAAPVFADISNWLINYYGIAPTR